ncbi:DNA polymerase Y family protein [Rhizobium sp. TRM95111]|uniref:DNA polymerase Y family protein n=1 Tax=Rhizobium alarense TaxID=2846851 RepID=UPI001F280DBE|nr:DNA polymerase Y family protein [Rhizobium alarense]
MRLVHLDSEAERRGLKAGQGVAEARAVCPALDVLPAEPVADRAFLEGLADWCGRFTPLVALDGEDGLCLDITGCAHLHGGERALLDGLLAQLFVLGIEARGAVSSSVGLSWAAARSGRGGVIAPEAAADTLSPLPVAALRLSRELAEALGRVGLKRIGDLLSLPRAPLARRFGPSLLLRLDQALGREDEPISPRLAVPLLSAERKLFEPVQAADDILGLARRLADPVREGLERRGAGGRLFELMLFRVDGKVFRIHAAASLPLRDPERIAGLFRERLDVLHDDLDAGFGFEIVRLSVLDCADFRAQQQDFSAGGGEEEALSVFVDRVRARYGPDCLAVATLCESHVPERASAFRPASDLFAEGTKERTARTSPAEALAPGTRPVRLFTRPEPVETVAEVPEGAPRTFRWRRSLHRISRAEGPERIAGEWWADGRDARTRDYFRVEDEEGRRYWLYREGFYGEKADPKWFLHGIFA